MVLLLAALLGLPAGLLVAGHSFVPTATGPGSLWREVSTTDPIHLVLVLAVAAGLVLWVSFALSVALEVVARVGKFPAPHVSGLGWAQGLAAVLLGLIIASSPSTTGTAHALTSSAPPPPSRAVSTAQSVATAPDQLPAARSAAHHATSTPPPAATPPDAAQKTPAELPTITTVRGDTLWQLAQHHLGDGMRWKEIADLNIGRAQPDGGHLGVDQPIMPNWHLHLPPDATNIPQATGGAPGVEEVIAQPGDSLSELAQAHLGDARLWPSVAAATAGVTQPDGHHLSDPNQLQVGWTVAIPDRAPTTPPAPRVPPTASPTEPPPPPPQTPAPAPPTPQPTPTAAPEVPPASMAATPVRQAPVNAGWITLSTYSAVGGLLAAGVLAALGTRRLVQARCRRPGQRLAGPTECSDVELALRTTEDPPTVALLDAALRTWAVRSPGEDLPDVVGALLGSTIRLLLTEPATPSSPFVTGAAATQWVLDLTDTVVHDTDVPAPFPTLVTLGRNTDGELVLIDLERVGAMTLAGDPDDVAGVLSAMAIELAGSRLADHLDVTVVGLSPDLVRYLGAGRLRHATTFEEVLNRLEHHHTEVVQALGEDAATSPVDARVRGVAEQAWIPELVLTAQPITVEQIDRLAAATTADTNLAAVITAADGARATLPGLCVVTVPVAGSTPVPVLDHMVTLQRLSTADRDALLADFAATDSDEQVPGPDAEAVPPEPAGAAVRAPREGEGTGSDAVPEPSEPSEAERTELATLLHLDPGAPEVQVLGPLQIAGVPPYTPDAKGASKVLELAVYLALNPGRTGIEVSRDLGDEGRQWADGTRRSRMSQLRTWWGSDASGADYVPKIGRGARYRLAPVIRSDWQRFQALSSRGLTRGPAGLMWLDAALALVRGIPFSGAPYDCYRWADIERREMINRIADVAHAAAIGHLPHDWCPARNAVLCGLRCDPSNEVLYRDLFRAEYAAGNLDGVRIAADRLRRITDDLGVDMHPATIELLEQLLDPRHRAARTAVP